MTFFFKLYVAVNYFLLIKFEVIVICIPKK